EQAYAVRKIIHSRGPGVKDKLKIGFAPDGRHAVVQVEDVSLPAKLVNLPCVIGSLKTVDRKTFYKTADISQMLVCSAHVSPPLKNVRKNRFRKIKKKDTKSPNVDKEVKRLLCSDAEAISVRWEVIADDDTKEIESQGCISGISGTAQMSGARSSENEMLREMFGYSGSNSNDVEDDDDDDDDDDEGDEEEEEEKKIDNLEDILERELQAQYIHPSFGETDKDYSAIITGIQKLIHVKEMKLQRIYKKARRQKELLENVKNLTLKVSSS
ncbi:Transcription initiation factor TFIID subunit 7-like, partial [Lemmus lemmus]